MRVHLLARPQFTSLPVELGNPRPDQVLGPDAQRLIETAGRCCYDSFGKGRDSDSYAHHILDIGHGSVLEHAQYSFFITGVSRGLTHELVRHRVGVAISQRSTRYCDESNSPWIMHPLLAAYIDEIERWPEGADRPRVDVNEAMTVKRLWNNSMTSCQNTYDLIVEKLEAYCVSKGLDKLTARKQARGAARGVLGNALETELVWSANVRALRHVINMRASDAADAEIRQLGCILLAIMLEELPVYFSDFKVGKSSDGLGSTATTDKPKV